MAKLIPGVNDLATVNPELAKEWHPTKNGDLKPSDVTKGSNIRVWWKCPVCEHEWLTQVNCRSRGTGCPACAIRQVHEIQSKPINGNSLANKNPVLAQEWHVLKNGLLTPEMVTPNSTKKVWWLCENGHEWQATIANRNNRHSGCPICQGREVLVGFNDLLTVNPGLAKEWNYEKNGDLKPTNVSLHSNKKVWWKCSEGHEWQAEILNRSNGSGCPYCSGRNAITGVNDLASVNPELAKEWHPTKNGDLTPGMFLPNAKQQIWWIGKCGHEWRSSIYSRTNGHGCPICQKESQTSFAEQSIYYYISKFFSDAINRDMSFGKELDVYIPSKHIGIEYDGAAFHKDVERDKKKNEFFKKKNIRVIRIREVACPDLDCGDVLLRYGDDNASLDNVISQLLLLLGCDDISVDVTRDGVAIMNLFIQNKKNNSFAIKHPDLVNEWHPIKNGNLKPDMFSSGSNKKVWWKCSNGHEWQASITSRSRGSGCPVCSSSTLLTGFNDLETKYPELAEEWHPTKNDTLKPSDVMASSNVKVWWLGKCGHEWQAPISRRSSGGIGCPICKGRQVLAGFNDLETKNPALAKEWDFEKNAPLKPTDVTSSSHRKVWWKCPRGHSYEATVNHRSSGHGCLICKNINAGERRKHPVVCLETGIMYDSIQDASIQTNIHATTISNCCNGRGKTAGGYHWKFVEK